MKKTVALLVSGIALVAGFKSGLIPAPHPRATHASGAVARRPSATIPRQASGEQIHDAGVVIRILADDNDGSRHQRFVIRLAAGQTLLIAHNIDLASRIESLSPGDRIEFSGEYEWNPQGGVVHWTHHDPAGRHPSGWIKHNGRTYR